MPFSRAGDVEKKLRKETMARGARAREAAGARREAKGERQRVVELRSALEAIREAWVAAWRDMVGEETEQTGVLGKSMV